MKPAPAENLTLKIKELEAKLADAEQLIEAIKAGEVDAFAVHANNQSEIFTLQSGDYAYRMLVENFNEGALNLSEDGLIVYTNSYFPQLLNLSYEKVIGNYIYQFIHPDSKEIFSALLKQSADGKNKGEINLIAGDAVIPVYISLTSLYPQFLTIGMIVTDLSEKKRNEQKLADAYKQFEEKNTALTKSNNELASFSYIASHDLQEPLRKIQTFSNYILEREQAALSENGKMIFGRMQLASQRMQTLINDLLTYSRTNNAEQKFEKINLREIVEEVMQDLKEELKDKKAVIEISNMCDAKILPFQFRQLLHNLIGNSLKFAAPGIAPVIKIESETISGNKAGIHNLQPDIMYCHFSITDNGIGFEPEFAEKIFELFQRLHTRHEYTGTGIGLSIVKRIVENHKGIIIAKSKLGQGASFHIYIPAG